MGTEDERRRVPGQGAPRSGRDGRGGAGVGAGRSGPDGTRAEGFAQALRERRRALGLSQSGLAREVHYDKSHISKVENGEKPPTADFARACDRALRAGGELVELATRGQCPYPGLTSFRAEDERWFHGRERARAELLGLLGERLADRGGPVVVVGPSGAGKSSLLRAGLLPALRRGALPGLGPAGAALLSPTAAPLERLAAVAEDRSPVWVVDQAEELFTLCQDAAERRAFLDRLCAEAGPGGTRLVVLGVRADVYGHCLAHEGLLRAVRRGQLALGPMSAAELSEAITAPARTARLDLEPGLLELLLADLGLDGGPGARAYDPGALPLLAHTLRAVWQQRTGRSLTLAGYRVIGGLHGSVALTAERAWSRLDGPARATARRVLLRLVHLGPDGQVSRRRAEHAQLAAAEPDGPRLDHVLASFAADRLITLDATGVTLSHEALLRAWPRLRGWIEEGRTGLRLHQQLAQDAEHWAASGREAALLYRGSRLELARQWAGPCDERGGPCDGPDGKGEPGPEDPGGRQDAESRRDREERRSTESTENAEGSESAAGASAVLAPVEREFLAAAAARQALERRAERRRVRARRRVAGALTLLVVAAVLAGALLWQERDRATAAVRGRTALALLTDARRNTTGDPYAALAQSLEARRVARAGVPELRRSADDAVLSSQSGYLAGRIPGFRWGVNALALSPDRRLVATGDSKGRVALWDTATTALVSELQGEVTHPVQDVEFSPDGALLAATLTRDPQRRVLLWRVADRRALPSPVMPSSASGQSTTVAKRVAFSADGTLLAAGSSDAGLPGRVWVWRVDAGAALPVRTLVDHTGAIQGLGFGPGHRLASAATDGTVLVRDLDAPVREDGGAPVVFSGRSPSPRSLAFAADGGLLAVGDEQGGIRLWRSPAGVLSPAGQGAGAEWPVDDLPARHLGPVNALGLTPDGATLVSAGADRSALVWDLPTRRVTAELRGHPTFVLGLAVGSDNRTVVTSAGISPPSGSVLVWDLRRGPDLAPGPDHPAVTAVAAAGGRAAVGTADGRTALWDVTGSSPRPVTVTAPTGRPVAALAFDRTGRTLVSAGENGVLRILDARDGSLRATTDIGARVEPTAVALSPDGTLLAAGTEDGRLLTGAPDGTPLHPRWHKDNDRVHAVAFLGDGAVVAFAHDSQYVELLDAADPAATARQNRIRHDDLVLRLAVSADGRRLATTGNDRLVHVWDARTGERQDSDGHTAGEDIAQSLVFAPDGRTVAGVGREGTLRLWDPSSPAAPTALSGPGQALNSVAFLPDGRALVGGDNGAAPLWSLSSDTAAARACAVLRAPLAREEWARLLPAAPYHPDCG
ncbi:nSTAND1 domain-containing NTPase [Kitasatospora sp. NPDC054795]